MVIGNDNFGLSFQRYPFDLNRLLREGCDKETLSKVLNGAMLGLCQLHELGYVHGNFRLSHVVCSNDGEDVRIIGLSSSVISTEQKLRMTSGVNLYEPKGWVLRLGSKVRDIYSAAIVTLMSYLSRDVFVKIKTSECLRHHAQRLIKDKTTDVQI